MTITNGHNCYTCDERYEQIRGENKQKSERRRMLLRKHNM